jgi:hypothetical protein
MSRLRVLLAVVAAAGTTGVGFAAQGEQPTLAAVEYIDPSVTVPPPKLVAAVVTEAPSTTTTTVAPPRPTTTSRPRPRGDGLHDENKKDTRPAPPPAGLPLGTPFIGRYVGDAIEGFARYDGQSTCDPSPKPGTLALRDLLLARYSNTTSLGVSRACEVGGQSEHKEGRAFDWGADVGDARDVASVNDFLNALFATDAQGHRYALARRMGIMYVIWNHQIWVSYNATEGWRPYDGENPHTNHVHISLSWAGARGETSYWSGSVVQGLPDITTSTTWRHRDHNTTTTTWRHRDHGTTTTSTSTSTSTTPGAPSTSTTSTTGRVG